MANTAVHPVPIPPAYGLMYDKEFFKARLETSDPRFLCLVQNADETLAAFSAVKQKSFKAFSVSLLTPLGGGAESPLVNGESWSDSELDGFMEGLLELPRWDIARFCGLPADNRALRIEQALTRHGLRFRRMPYESRVIKGFKDFSEFSKSRSHNFRSVLSRAKKKINGLNFSFAERIEFREWADLYARRHKKITGDDYSVALGFQRFFEKYRNQTSAEGRYFETGLYKGSTLVAAACGVRVGEILYFYQTAHDPDLGEYRPGVLIFNQILEQALRQEPSMITFQSNAGYLAQYTDQVVELVELEVFAPTILGNALCAYRKFKNIQPYH